MVVFVDGASVIDVIVWVVVCFRSSPSSVRFDRPHSVATGAAAAAAAAAAEAAAAAAAAGAVSFSVGAAVGAAGGTVAGAGVGGAPAGTVVVAFPLSKHAQDSVSPLCCLSDGCCVPSSGRCPLRPEPPSTAVSWVHASRRGHAEEGEDGEEGVVGVCRRGGSSGREHCC